jgi:hypothetical protein
MSSRDEQKCFGSNTPAIFTVNTPDTGECRDCNSTVETDAKGNAVKHTTGDPLCFASRLGK